MPEVIYYHLWGEGEYDYSEGVFYTVADKYPDVEQQNYFSSGCHIGLGTRERILEMIREHITRDLQEDSSWKYATVGELTADENDHYCCFSGPPSEFANVYKLDRDSLVFDRKFFGTDILKIEKR
jgi:hypothetical protein